MTGNHGQHTYHSLSFHDLLIWAEKRVPATLQKVFQSAHYQQARRLLLEALRCCAWRRSHERSSPFLKKITETDKKTKERETRKRIPIVNGNDNKRIVEIDC